MKKRTKPPYSPSQDDRKKVEFLAGFGMTHEQIALIMGISEPTLRKYHDQDLRLGKVKATANVAKTLYQQATNAEKPNISAAIFWLKCQAGWKEAKDEDVGKKDKVKEEAKQLGETGRFRPRLVSK